MSGRPCGSQAQNGGGKWAPPSTGCCPASLPHTLLASLPLNPKVPSSLLWTESQEDWLLLNTRRAVLTARWSISLLPALPSPFPFLPLAPLQLRCLRPYTAATGCQSSRLDPGPCSLMSQYCRPASRPLSPSQVVPTALAQCLRLGPRLTRLRMLPSPQGGGTLCPLQVPPQLGVTCPRELSSCFILLCWLSRLSVLAEEKSFANIKEIEMNE